MRPSTSPVISGFSHLSSAYFTQTRYIALCPFKGAFSEWIPVYIFRLVRRGQEPGARGWCYHGEKEGCQDQRCRKKWRTWGGASLITSRARRLSTEEKLLWSPEKTRSARLFLKPDAGCGENALGSRRRLAWEKALDYCASRAVRYHGIFLVLKHMRRSCAYGMDCCCCSPSARVTPQCLSPSFWG